MLDELDVHYDEEEEERILNKLMSELAFENFPGMPKEGDSFVYLNLRITILSMKRSRIYRLRVEKLPEEGADEEGGSV